MSSAPEEETRLTIYQPVPLGAPYVQPYVQPAHRRLGIPRPLNFFRTMLQLNMDLLRVMDVIQWIPPHILASETHVDPCPVCLDPIVCGQRIYLLGCTHSFHCHCLRPWIMEQAKRTCPMCRQAIR